MVIYNLVIEHSWPPVADVIRKETREHPIIDLVSVSKGRSVHIYWELAERETENGKMARAPVYIAVDAGDPDQELAIRLPKGIAIRLLTAFSDNFAEEVARYLTHPPAEFDTVRSRRGCL